MTIEECTAREAMVVEGAGGELGASERGEGQRAEVRREK